MKFVPITTTSGGECYNNYIYRGMKNKPTFMINIPVSHLLGFYGCVFHTIQYGGPVAYHTQNLRDIGFIPEIILDDMIEVKMDRTILFPFHFNEFKKLFDDHHPHCEKWKKFISSRNPYCFRNGGAPLSNSIDDWFNDTFGIRTCQDYGSSETGAILTSDFNSKPLPGEETYFSKFPHCELYLKPLDDNDPSVGELFVHSPTLTTGYISKAKPGEFYESDMPGMRTDIDADKLFVYFEGKKFLKTNDIVIRSPKSGKYKYVSRSDDVLVFETGLKMNPIPFERTVSSECEDISRCCLIIDDTKTEVVCFVEPLWEKIILDNGKPVNTNVDAATLSKKELDLLNKTAQKQIWNSIYNLLMDDSKSLNNWAKQLTINNIVILNYGKKFTTTSKGSLSRRITKVEYDYILKKISKLITGEIKSLEEIEDGNGSGNEKEEDMTDSTEIIKENSSENDETYNDDETSIYDSGDDEQEYDDDDDNEKTETTEIIEDNQHAYEEVEQAIRMIHESIKEIIPSTPEFNKFNPDAPFTVYGIDSLSVIKLTNVLSRKFNKKYSPAILFTYGTTASLAKYLKGYENISYLPSQEKDHGASSNKKIAIIGMAFRLPGAISNSKSLWMALAKSRDCILPPVKTRDLHHGYVNKPANQLGPKEHYLARVGCYDVRPNVAKPSEFDADFFNCSPEEATALDPRHRWILETSWEALENAGIVPSSLKNTITGVFVGMNNDHEHEDLLKKCGKVPPLAAHATAQSSIAGRLSYFYELFGPSYTIDTACSTGSSALHSACQSMQCGDCDLSIVSGVKYMYSSDEFHKTCAARMTSPNSRCATFDASADGFAQSEGCVTFVLKRLEDAIRDKDNILSVILGSSSGQSGLRQSISAPSSEGQRITIQRAMKVAGITPDQVSYVEAHGTGTPLGDAIEVHALNQVYAGSHTEENPLVVGSIKSNVGHTCEAAGLAGIAKVIVAMKHNTIPKNIHFNELNPEIDLSVIPMKIPTKNLPWNSSEEGKPLIAQVSSFGLQGSIIVTFLEQYLPPKEEEEEKKKEKVLTGESSGAITIASTKSVKKTSNVEGEGEGKDRHFLTISTKTYAALLDLYDNYLNIIENMNEDEDIRDLCYTSNVGRQHFAYRLIANGRNVSELSDSLEEEMSKLEEKFEEAKEKEKEKGEGETEAEAEISILTSKQKSGHRLHLHLFAEGNHNEKLPKEFFQYVSDLYHRLPSFRQAIKECDKEIKKLTQYKYSLIKDLASLGEESKKSNLSYLGNVLVLALHYAFYKVIRSIHPIEGTLLVGYGYGELAAILNAGGISFGKAAQFLKLLIQPKAGIIFRSIKKWYKTGNLGKLRSNIFVLSNHHEYKSEKTIPLNCWISMAKVLLNNNKLKEKYVVKGNTYIVKTYGDVMEELCFYSTQSELSGLLNGSIAGIAEKLQISNMIKLPLYNFNDYNNSEDSEKDLDHYLIENYKKGDVIHWKEFHKRLNPNTTTEYPLHKIELPTYPFQRSVFWPTSN